MLTGAVVVVVVVLQSDDDDDDDDEVSLGACLALLGTRSQRCGALRRSFKAPGRSPASMNASSAHTMVAADEAHREPTGRPPVQRLLPLPLLLLPLLLCFRIFPSCLSSSSSSSSLNVRFFRFFSDISCAAAFAESFHVPRTRIVSSAHFRLRHWWMSVS